MIKLQRKYGRITNLSDHKVNANQNLTAFSVGDKFYYLLPNEVGDIELPQSFRRFKLIVKARTNLS